MSRIQQLVDAAKDGTLTADQAQRCVDMLATAGGHDAYQLPYAIGRAGGLGVSAPESERFRTRNLHRSRQAPRPFLKASASTGGRTNLLPDPPPHPPHAR